MCARWNSDGNICMVEDTWKFISLQWESCDCNRMEAISPKKLKQHRQESCCTSSAEEYRIVLSTHTGRRARTWVNTRNETSLPSFRCHGLCSVDISYELHTRDYTNFIACNVSTTCSAIGHEIRRKYLFWNFTIYDPCCCWKLIFIRNNFPINISLSCSKQMFYFYRPSAADC